MSAAGGAVAPVLVLGGTGHYGRRIVAALVAQGVPARVLTRDPARARLALGDGPETVPGDLEDRAALARAVAGVRAVVVAVSAFQRGQYRRLREIERDGVLGAVEQARAAGVRRLVYLSGYDRPRAAGAFAEIGAMAEIGRIKAEVEDALVATDLDWTVLGLCPSMELFFSLLRGDRLIAPGGGPPALPTVSAVDVGAIGAEAALRDDLGRQRFRVVGPRALSFAEAARILAEATGRPIRVRAVPLLPFRLGYALLRPFSPYLAAAVSLPLALARFPEEVAAGAAADHRRLQETFHYPPTSLADEARRRFGARRGLRSTSGQ
ncbi:MAG: NAD(P)H-binding protein [Deltaproteobacteria bacterium]|nr:NAD(P)H-binding protein [Deltaproteobacteria bacterium]